MKTYEYKAISQNPYSFENNLKYCGENGWKLISSIIRPDGKVNHYLMKTIKNKPDSVSTKDKSEL